MSAERPFTAALSSEPADWLVERLTDFGLNVVSIVPSGFEAYARVFHPASRVTCISDADQTSTSEPLRWSEIAELTKRTAHRAMQWASIQGSLPVFNDYSKLKAGDVYIEPPEEGSLPLELAQTLWPILGRHTQTPDACFFAIWEGFGGYPKYIYEAPTFELPERCFHLFRASTQTIEQSFYAGAEPDMAETVFMAFSDEEAALPPAELQEQIQVLLDVLNASPPRYQSANLWWPQDRAWCVHTEIDFDTTYLTGSQRLVDSLVSSKKLEAYQAEPTDEIVSDTVNPTPADPYDSGFKLE